MEVIEFIKKEISGWKHYEILSLLAVFCLILYNALKLHDHPAAMLSAIFGILYTTLAGKGKISCYVFGILGSSCYIWLSIVNHFWGNALLYMLYYVPMQVNGIFLWKKHLNKKSFEINKSRLKPVSYLKYLLVSIFGCLFTCTMLYFMKDTNPLIDGITTFLSIIGMYFTVKRYIDQWIVWLIVNGLTFLMWLDLILHGAKFYSTLVMWGFYFVLAIYFYCMWYKELRTKCFHKTEA